MDGNVPEDGSMFMWLVASRPDFRSYADETNDRVMVHGDGTRADALMSMWFARISEIRWSRDRSFNTINTEQGRRQALVHGPVDTPD